MLIQTFKTKTEYEHIEVLQGVILNTVINSMIMNELHLQKSNILRNHQLQHGPVMKQDNITHKLWHLCLFSTNMVPWKEPSNQPSNRLGSFPWKENHQFDSYICQSLMNSLWWNSANTSASNFGPSNFVVLFCCQLFSTGTNLFLVEIGVTGSWLGTSTGTVSVEITEAFIFCQNTKV